MKIENIEYFSELSASSVPALLGNVQDKIVCEITYSVLTEVRATEANPIIVNETDELITVPGTSWIVDPLNRFDERFPVGSVVVVGDYATNTDHGDYTIVEKYDNGRIRLNPDIEEGGFALGYDEERVHYIISLKTPITAVEHRFNLVENSEAPNWISKIDGSEQLLKIEDFDCSNVTPVNMEFVGPLNYQIGSATIEGIAITDTFLYKSEFKITHTFYINPFFLANDYLDAVNGVKPSYFEGLKALKHIFETRALYVYTNPDRYEVVSQLDVEGNTGWFDERFNGNATNYSIDDLEFHRYPSLAAIPAVELVGTSQTVTFSIKNATDSPFSSGNTKVIVQFCRVPYDVTEYDGSVGSDSVGRDMKHNFVFDRVELTNGAGSPVDGENDGTDNQVIKNATCTHVSSSEIQVGFLINFADENLAVLNEGELPTYCISVSVQNHTLDTEVADKVNLLVDLAEFYIDNTDPDMIVAESLFLRHYEDDVDTQGTGALDCFVGDECVNYTKFYIDTVGREDNDIKLKSFTQKIKVKNTVTLEEFTLDVFSQNVSGYPIVGGLQQIDFNVNRVFNIPSDEPRKKIKYKRRVDLDAAGKYYYDLYFPFLIRWEYFIALAGVSTDFYDTDEMHNGLNHEWFKYKSGDWKIYYETKIVATKDDVSLAYTFEDELTIHDWASNNRYTVKTIKSYDPDTLTELVDGLGKKYIYGYKNTLIEARFTGGIVASSEYIGVITIEVHENTGVNEIRRLSSYFVKGDDDTWLESIDGSDKTVVDKPSTTNVRARCLVDYTKIPANPIFKIACRIYEVSGEEFAFSKRTEEGTMKKMEDGVQKETEFA